jgi:hypothetical protein
LRGVWRCESLFDRSGRPDLRILVVLRNGPGEVRDRAGPGLEILQCGERYLVFEAFLPDEADDDLVGAEAFEGEQAFVDVADLLDVQCPERQATPLLGDGDVLDRGEHVHDGAVVHSDRLEPLNRLGVEDGAVVGGHGQLRMADASVHGAEQGEHALPGCGGTLLNVLAFRRRLLLELFAEPACRIGGLVEGVVGRKQAAFLGIEEEDDAHHDRDGGAIYLVSANVQAAAGLLDAAQIVATDRVNEHLDCASDLDAESLGDVLLVVEALAKQGGQAVVVRRGEEPGALQQRAERAHDDPVAQLRPGHGVENGGRGDAADRGPDKGPPAAVGDQTEFDVAGSAELGDPVDRGRGPHIARDARGRVLAG